MTPSYKSIARLLKLKDLLLVGLTFHKDNIARLHVKPKKNGCRCPVCDRRCRIVRERTQAREWRDLTVGGWQLQLVYRPREIHCVTHGRVQERIPWAEAAAQTTYRFEFVMLKLCKNMTQKAAAEILGVAPSTLSDLLHRSIERHRSGHKIRGLKHLGVDEIAFKKRRKYATLVYDLDRSKVIWIGEGKGRDTIDDFFNNQLTAYQRGQIKAACSDMSAAYMGAIKHHCPNAALVIDRFHVVKALNDAVDEIRKQQWRELSREDRKVYRGIRWLLYRHSTTRTEDQTKTLKQLEKSNRRIYRAWQLKEEFEAFWDYNAPWASERFLKAWLTRCMRSRLDPLKKFARTIRKHMDALLAYTTHQITNAVSEGLNRIAKIVKNRASGFRRLEPFSDLIMLTIGDLDIPEQIPSKFRTL